MIREIRRIPTTTYNCFNCNVMFEYECLLFYFISFRIKDVTLGKPLKNKGLQMLKIFQETPRFLNKQIILCNNLYDQIHIYFMHQQYRIERKLRGNRFPISNLSYFTFKNILLNIFEIIILFIHM